MCTMVSGRGHLLCQAAVLLSSTLRRSRVPMEFRKYKTEMELEIGNWKWSSNLSEHQACLPSVPA